MELQTPQFFAEGGVGKIYVAKWRQTYVAVKKLKQEYHQKDYIEEFIREYKILEKLRHPNIVTFMGFCNEDSNYCIVQEFCVNKSLFSVIQT